VCLVGVLRLYLLWPVWGQAAMCDGGAVINAAVTAGMQ
jgi:hypothetical protein